MTLVKALYELFWFCVNLAVIIEQKIKSKIQIYFLFVKDIETQYPDNYESHPPSLVLLHCNDRLRV